MGIKTLQFFQVSILKDIRFWIVLAFVIRLHGITNPPLEVSHNWRQTTVTMVARNFYEIDNNILYPRIDIAGEKTGITGMEFPVFNYIIYLFSLAFGYSHWYGRLINLVVSSIGLLFFYKLIKRYFEENIAFMATIILISSIWFVFSRKIMPDTFSMSFVIIGVYYASNYFDRGNKIKDILLYTLFVCIGVLSKLPSIYILIVAVPFVFSNTYKIKKKFIFVAFSILLVIPVASWYFYWVPYLVDEFGFWHFFMGNSFAKGAHEILHNLPAALANFYDKPLKFIGFGFFLAGLIMAIRKRETKLLWIFCLSFFSFLIIVFKSGETFSKHDYYIIPFVPVMALVSAYGISQIKHKKWTTIILLAIALEGIANQQHDLHNNKNLDMLELENNLDSISSRDDLILFNSNYYPTPMYFAHRKGWVEINSNITPSYINSLSDKGLKYIVILKQNFGSDMDLDLELVFENEFYKVYKI